MLFTSGNSTIGCPRLGQVSWILQRHFWRDLFSKYVYRLVSIKWMFVHLYMCIDLFGPFYNFIPVFLSISSMYKHICESFKTFLGINHLRFLGFFSHTFRWKESPRLLVICWLHLRWASSREVNVQTWMTTKESGGTRRGSWSNGHGFFVGLCPPFCRNVFGCDPRRKHEILVVTKGTTQGISKLPLWYMGSATPLVNEVRTNLHRLDWFSSV